VRIIRRNFLQKVMAGAGSLLPLTGTVPSGVRPEGNEGCSLENGGESLETWGPDPIFEKPEPITMAQLRRESPEAVAAYEVSDYTPAGYQGNLAPSPPHADHNPRRAVIIVWKNKPHRLVFSHEASYDPWIELPNGVGLCNQFFEGNNGWAELFNNNGRKERNSFVDIIQSGEHPVWLRWNYFCVNNEDDSQPALRGTEDYVAFPNGLVWRRLTYSTLRPEKPEGYSWQPIDFFALAPAGTEWKDLFPVDELHGDYHVGSVLDAYSSRRYDVFWNHEGAARRTGDAPLLMEISHSHGFAMVMPFKAGFLFTVMGTSSGFPSEKSQIVDHSFKDTGGWGWGAARWDHWPIGWANAQMNHYKPGSPYPYHFAPFSHYIVNNPLRNAGEDYPIEARDMDLNKWSERHVYYTLIRVGETLESVRGLARQWLDRGSGCANAQTISDLI